MIGAANGCWHDRRHDDSSGSDVGPGHDPGHDPGPGPGFAGMTRIAPGLLAILIGSAVALILFVPFVAASFRARGGFGWRRAAAWFALLVSFLAIWAYTILPAPLPTEAYTCTTANLDILRDLRDIIALQQGGSSLIANAALQVTVLNVALFVPIGFLVRIVFHRGIPTALLVGFLFSLLVETTQLTGLWGVYPCAYRFFSVGDLLHNTIGAVIGSALALLVTRRPASIRSRGEGVRPPARLTAMRRLLGMLCDVLLFAVVSVLAGLALDVFGAGRVGDAGETSIGTVIGLLAYLVPLLLTGTSPGESAVLLIGTGGRFSPGLARVIRAGAGLGGFIALSEFVPVVGDALALALGAATVVLVFTTRDHRGLAGLAAGMDIVDARASLESDGSLPVRAGRRAQM